MSLHLRWWRGERLHLRGSVYPPRNGGEVVLQQRLHTGWKTVAKVRLRKVSAQRSHYMTTLAHATPGLYRAVLRGDAAHRRSTSHTRRARARRLLTLQVHVLTRQRLRLSGTVTPRRDAGQVMLQVRTRAGWKTVASAHLRNAAGRRAAYTMTRRHLEPGVYRAHCGADSAYRSSNSRRVRVR